jgi:hypothetical protein
MVREMKWTTPEVPGQDYTVSLGRLLFIIIILTTPPTDHDCHASQAKRCHLREEVSQGLSAALVGVDGSGE